MCLFLKIFARWKSTSNYKFRFNENIEIQNCDKATASYSEEATVANIVETKTPLDQQIHAAQKKVSTSDANSASENSGRNIGPRIPRSAQKTDKGR